MKKLFHLAALPTCIAAVISIMPVTTHAVEVGQNTPVTTDSLPPGLLKKQLKSLPPQARDKAEAWLNSIHFHRHDIPYLRADKEGGIYFADTFLPETITTTKETNSVLPPDSNIDVFKLHSKPGASNIIYLDFDGHIISGTAWNSSTPSYNAVPYDLDGIPGSVSSTEQANIAEIWRRVAEDYAPFDVDVTTEEPSSFNAKTGRLLITTDTDAYGQAMPAQGAGGVAYVGVWGRSDYHTKYSPAFVYYNRLGGGRPDYVTEAASHEMGHNMGLSHDGTSTASYHGGHGSGETSWGSIMGTGYNRNISQWSKGEYLDANQTQDDIAILVNKVNYRADDHANQLGAATPIVVNSTGEVLATTRIDDPDTLNNANRGIIGSRNDVDYFSFATTGGAINLQVQPDSEPNSTSGTNLDVRIVLFDAQGSEITRHEPVDTLQANISLSLPAGTYYLGISGSGADLGNASYSDYGSLGYYRITGTLPVFNDSTPPQPNPMGWSNVPAANDTQSVSMNAITATDDNSGVEYYFTCSISGTSCTDSGWQASTRYTLTGLNPETTYTFTVKARDMFSNETTASVAASVTTPAAPAVNDPPTANDDTATVALNNSVLIPVLINDTDPENYALTISNVSTPNKGTVVIEGDQLRYTAGRKRGGDSFSYTIQDTEGNTASASVNVSIVRSVSDGSDGGTDDGTGGDTGGKGGGKGKKK